ncbi:MAG: hypothetical protein NTW86_04865 [Candidatus Sumerlaeota bacterium]|nr:hypothetical protein [Candidatus Sumerlaeota bacterium]
MTRQMRVMLAILMVAVALCGCIRSRKEFALFAQAGKTYAAAEDALLTAAGDAQVDSTSWSLIAEKVDAAKTGKTVEKQLYDDWTQEDEKRLKTIADLRAQARLLGRYFTQLGDLATSDAPERVQKAIEGTIASLTELGAPQEAGVSAVPSVAGVATDWWIRAALRHELEKRKDLIRLELAAHRKLVERVKGQIAQALTKSNEIQVDGLVLAPLRSANPINESVKWVALRHEMVNLPVSVAELDKAAHAATELSETFDSLVSGKLTMARLNALMTDVEALLSIAEKIKSGSVK